jgi:hypothetical protein
VARLADSGRQIVYCCWIVVELVFVYFFIIETKGRSLEETAALFDGDEAEAAVTANAIAEVREIEGDAKEKV